MWSGKAKTRVLIGRNQVAWRIGGQTLHHQTSSLAEGLRLVLAANAGPCEVHLDGDLTSLLNVPAVAGVSAPAEAEAAAKAWLHLQGRSFGRVRLLGRATAGQYWPLLAINDGDWKLLCDALNGRASHIRPWWSGALSLHPGQHVALDGHALHHVQIDSTGSITSVSNVRPIESDASVARWLQRQQAAENQPIADHVVLQNGEPKLPPPWRVFEIWNLVDVTGASPFELLGEQTIARRSLLTPVSVALLAISSVVAGGSWVAWNDARRANDSWGAERAAWAEQQSAGRQLQATTNADAESVALRLQAHVPDILRAIEECHPEGAQTNQVQIDSAQATASVQLEGPPTLKAQQWVACLNAQSGTRRWTLDQSNDARNGRVALGASARSGRGQ